MRNAAVCGLKANARKEIDSDDSRTRFKTHGGHVCAAFVSPGALGSSLLVFVHGFCWTESASVGTHELVPGDVPFEESGAAPILIAA